jgi:uncharacterized small protein (DUF1192 family)
MLLLLGDVLVVVLRVRESLEARICEVDSEQEWMKQTRKSKETTNEAVESCLEFSNNLFISMPLH